MFVLAEEAERQMERNGTRSPEVSGKSQITSFHLTEQEKAPSYSGLLDFTVLCFKKPAVWAKIICFRALLARNSALSSKSKDICLNCSAAGY